MATITQHHFSSHDGVSLFYQHRPAVAATATKKAIVLFHRGHEHSGRILHVAEELVLDDCDFFAWDARGHGMSPGERGDAPSFGAMVADVDAFIRHIQTTYNIAAENIVVVAQSVGAVVVATWLHDYAPNIRGAVLTSPAFKVKLYVPFAQTGLSLMQKLRGNFFVQSYVKAHYLSHDPERIHSYQQDDKITRAISVRILLGLYQAAERVVKDAAAITTPIQLLISGRDWVVHHGPQHDFYNNLGSHIKERIVFEGFYHDTLGEKDRELAIDAMRRFIRKLYETPLQSIDLTQAHVYGDSKREADELATPLSPLSVRGAYWNTQRASIALGAKWSQGLKLGQDTGFDSGSTLDYVYRNTPTGSNGFGRLVDKNYLNAIGWRGIRQRKQNLQTLIQDAMQRLRAQGQAVHVLDIAAGHGRYVLDALTAAEKPDSIRLRDYSAINVEAGRKLIQERQLQDIASFDEVNAYERTNYQNLDPQPTLGIVSGLHELFPDNDLINQSLLGFADAIDSGNYLIYTNQPWHPQLEMIARCLTSHRQGEAWVMRRRSQREMDQLVAAAGFDKVRQLIDEDGIFTVTLAQKR